MFLPAEYNTGSIAAITNSRFTGNSAEADFGLATGGTIQNNGTITEIKNSDFLNNYTLSNEHSARGGAIQNSTRSVIEQIINSKFDGNYAKVAPSTKYFSTNGGAIDNSGTINLIADSEFTNNYIELTTGTNLGGALHNTGQIGKISNVKFIGNTTNSQTGRGGAIYSAGKITEIVNSEFTDNRIIGQQGYGGALNLTNGITITNSKFENNSIQAEKGAGSGGAINFSSAQDIILKNSSFYNNFIKGKHITNAKGGAVYKAGTGSLIIEADGSIGNGKSVLNIDAGQMDPDTTYKVQIIKAENQEHAPQLKLNDIDAITQISADIFSNTLLAAGFGVATTDTQNDSIEIRGAQDALAEWAELSADTKSFTFAPDALKTVLTRDISGLQGKELNINGIAGSELDAAGHNLLSNINKGQKINFSDLTVSNFGNIANSGTVDLHEDTGEIVSFSSRNIGSLQGNGNLMIDVDIKNRLSDNLNITDGSQNGGTVHLSSINVRSDGTGGNNILTYLKGILSGLNFTVGDNDQGISTMTEDYVYTFTKGDAGMLNVVQTLVTGGNTLKHFIEGVLPVNVNTYSATNDIAVLDTEVTLGTTNNTDYKTLNLNMNGYKLTGYDGNGQKNDGIAVAGDYTFNLQGSSKNEANSLLSNFAKALTVAENGKLNIVDVTFSDNETDIENSGTINFTGSNKADTITGTGTMTVASGKTQINATIEQDTVNIEENAALTNKGLMTANAVINGTFINDGSTNGNITITDSGLLTNNQTLNSDNFTNTGNITNIDILNAKLFENTGTVDNNGTVTADNLINKAGGKLTSSVSALRVNNRLQNDGTLNLAGGANNSQNWAKEINGSGKLNFSGKVRNTAALSQGNITITAGAQLTNEGLLNAAIINNGTMITSANSLGGTTTSNNTSVLQLTGGTLTQNILGDGNAQILGNVILSGNGLLNLKTGINEGASLTGSAGSLGDTVTNAGILNLTGETLSIDIQGKEQTQINGNVTLANNGSISQNVTIGNNAMLTVNQLSGLISTVRNDGTLKLLEGTAVHQINGSGTIQIAGNVINNTVFDNLVKVENGAEFTNNGTISQETTNSGAFINATAAGLNGSVNNLSEGRFTNRGTIDGNIDNSGTFFNRGTISGNINNRLGGTFTSRADRFQGTVNNAGELILSGILNKNISGTGTTIVGGNTFGMNGGVKIDGIFNLNNKILNLQEQGANEDADYGER